MGKGFEMKWNKRYLLYFRVGNKGQMYEEMRYDEELDVRYDEQQQQKQNVLRCISIKGIVEMSVEFVK